MAVFKQPAKPTVRTMTYAIFMPSYGVILKLAESITEARKWARAAFPQERGLTHVVRAVACKVSGCCGGQAPCAAWVRDMEGVR